MIPYPRGDPGSPLRLGRHACRVELRSRASSSKVTLRGSRRFGAGRPTQGRVHGGLREQLLPLLLAERGRAGLPCGARPAPDALGYDAGHRRRRSLRDGGAARLAPVAPARAGRLGLLDGLRERGLAVGVVSNLFDPASSCWPRSRRSGCSSGSMRSPSRRTWASASRTRRSSSPLSLSSGWPRPRRDGRRSRCARTSAARRRSASRPPGDVVCATTIRAPPSPTRSLRSPPMCSPGSTPRRHNLKNAVLSSLAENEIMLQRSRR